MKIRYNRQQAEQLGKGLAYFFAVVTFLFIVYYIMKGLLSFFRTLRRENSRLGGIPSLGESRMGRIPALGEGRRRPRYEPNDGSHTHPGGTGGRGPPGKQGMRGMDGQPGRQGPPGKQGRQGPPGKQGKQGPPGRQGPPGKSGKIVYS